MAIPIHIVLQYCVIHLHVDTYIHTYIRTCALYKIYMYVNNRGLVKGTHVQCTWKQGQGAVGDKVGRPYSLDSPNDLCLRSQLLQEHSPWTPALALHHCHTALDMPGKLA